MTTAPAHSGTHSTPLCRSPLGRGARIVRVIEPVSMHEWRGTAEEAMAEARKRMQAALDGINAGLSPRMEKNPFWINPVKPPDASRLHEQNIRPCPKQITGQQAKRRDEGQKRRALGQSGQQARSLDQGREDGRHPALDHHSAVISTASPERRPDWAGAARCRICRWRAAAPTLPPGSAARASTGRRQAPARRCRM